MQSAVARSRQREGGAHGATEGDSESAAESESRVTVTSHLSLPKRSPSPAARRGPSHGHHQCWMSQAPQARGVTVTINCTYSG